VAPIQQLEADFFVFPNRLLLSWLRNSSMGGSRFGKIYANKKFKDENFACQPGFSNRIWLCGLV
jgi:hypothetical protein